MLPLSWLENDGLTPVSVTVLNTETKKLEKISVRKDLETALHLNGEQLGEQKADLVSMMLYLEVPTMNLHPCVVKCHGITD